MRKLFRNVIAKMPHANICLFTSIRLPTDPEAISYLRDCLNSWRTAGFDAVAVNGPAETKALRWLDLPVEFAVTAADGKPRIGAILSAIRARGCRFAGIINSDCRIIGYPNVAAALQAGLERTAVLAWRIDVGPDLMPTTMRGGFDAYFFDTEVMPRDDGGVFIGGPWGDYLFPFACEMSGAWVETLAVPLLTHKAHPANWNEQSFICSGNRFWTAFQGWHLRGAVPKSLLAQIPNGWRLDGTPLDVVFNEDDARTRKDYGPQNLAVIRRIAINILRAHPDNRSVGRKMNLAAWRQDFFFDLFAHLR